MTPVRIIGLGSPHGADAAGWYALWGLQRLGLGERFPAGLVSLENCAAPVHLFRLVEGCRLAVLIDAVRDKGEQLLTIPAHALQERRVQASLHGLGVEDMLGLLEAVCERPPRVLLFAIPVGNGGSARLARDRVAALLPALSRRVEEAVRPMLEASRSTCDPDARPGAASPARRPPLPAEHR